MKKILALLSIAMLISTQAFAMGWKPGSGTKPTDSDKWFTEMGPVSVSAEKARIAALGTGATPSQSIKAYYDVYCPGRKAVSCKYPVGGNKNECSGIWTGYKECTGY